MFAGFHRTQISWVRGTQQLGSTEPSSGSMTGFEEPSNWVPSNPVAGWVRWNPVAGFHRTQLGFDDRVRAGFEEPNNWVPLNPARKNIFEDACSSFILIHVLKQIQQDYMLHFPKCEEQLEIENVNKKKKKCQKKSASVLCLGKAVVEIH
ncbi:hypothetical protein SLEP1_g55598 [Rubroshorea leprosula]|uniref:Uncharacterized protein n=1 Tax=Rubroshorea leprosula TaxID=152421 RepID=A0AAV5MJ28_9ROSI|nr:hypothetical protein SLEP1_g55598 [Rubroshorea leprosula]